MAASFASKAPWKSERLGSGLWSPTLRSERAQFRSHRRVSIAGAASAASEKADARRRTDLNTDVGAAGNPQVAAELNVLLVNFAHPMLIVIIVKGVRGMASQMTP